LAVSINDDFVANPALNVSHLFFEFREGLWAQVA
jgi:hypothetical protein